MKLIVLQMNVRNTYIIDIVFKKSKACVKVNDSVTSSIPKNRVSVKVINKANSV